MNVEDLYEAIGDIDEEFIADAINAEEQARKNRRKNSILIAVASVAAAVAGIAVVLYLCFFLLNQSPRTETTLTKTQTEAIAQYGDGLLLDKTVIEEYKDKITFEECGHLDPCFPPEYKGPIHYLEYDIDYGGVRVNIIIDLDIDKEPCWDLFVPDHEANINGQIYEVYKSNLFKSNRYDFSYQFLEKRICITHSGHNIYVTSKNEDLLLKTVAGMTG